MASKTDAAVAALEDLAARVVNSWSDDRMFSDAFGWNSPPLTRHELSASISAVADRLKGIPDKRLTPNLETRLSMLPQKLSFYVGNVLPQLYGGNCPAAVGSLETIITWLNIDEVDAVPAEIDWTSPESQKLLPPELLRRLRSIESILNKISDRAGDLENKISVIEAAHAAAESLPTDLQSLSEARSEVEVIRASATADLAKIQAISEESPKLLAALKSKNEEAKKLVENCEDAYSAATTKGLGEAFSIKAKQLSNSMWVWVGGLLLALVAGYMIGHERIDKLQQAIAKPETSTALIVVNLVLTVFSIAAPVWFAWIATKQIGQRFRLSEDYGFKASVAKAYEGYRREAARLDPSFAARLFGTALSRIEEAPLRFVESDNHGSPLHEWSSKFGGIKTPFDSVLSRGQTRDEVIITPKSGILNSDSDASQVTDQQ